MVKKILKALFFVGFIFTSMEALSSLNTGQTRSMRLNRLNPDDPAQVAVVRRHNFNYRAAADEIHAAGGAAHAAALAAAEAAHAAERAAHAGTEGRLAAEEAARHQAQRDVQARDAQIATDRLAHGRAIAAAQAAHAAAEAALRGVHAAQIAYEREAARLEREEHQRVTDALAAAGATHTAEQRAHEQAEQARQAALEALHLESISKNQMIDSLKQAYREVEQERVALAHQIQNLNQSCIEGTCQGERNPLEAQRIQLARDKDLLQAAMNDRNAEVQQIRKARQQAENALQGEMAALKERHLEEGKEARKIQAETGAHFFTQIAEKDAQIGAFQQASAELERDRRGLHEENQRLQRLIADQPAQLEAFHRSMAAVAEQEEQLRGHIEMLQREAREKQESFIATMEKFSAEGNRMEEEYQKNLARLKEHHAGQEGQQYQAAVKRGREILKQRRGNIRERETRLTEDQRRLEVSYQSEINQIKQKNAARERDYIDVIKTAQEAQQASIQRFETEIARLQQEHVAAQADLQRELAERQREIGELENAMAATGKLAMNATKRFETLNHSCKSGACAPEKQQLVAEPQRIQQEVAALRQANKEAARQLEKAKLDQKEAQTIFTQRMGALERSIMVQREEFQRFMLDAEKQKARKEKIATGRVVLVRFQQSRERELKKKGKPSADSKRLQSELASVHDEKAALEGQIKKAIERIKKENHSLSASLGGETNLLSEVDSIIGTLKDREAELHGAREQNEEKRIQIEHEKEQARKLQTAIEEQQKKLLILQRQSKLDSTHAAEATSALQTATTGPGGMDQSKRIIELEREVTDIHRVLGDQNKEVQGAVREQELLKGKLKKKEEVIRENIREKEDLNKKLKIATAALEEQVHIGEGMRREADRIKGEKQKLEGERERDEVFVESQSEQIRRLEFELQKVKRTLSFSQPPSPQKESELPND